MEILVLGGSYAGLAAAVRAKRIAGARCSVRLVTEHRSFYERIRLHEVANRRTEIEADVTAFLGGTGVDVEFARINRIDLEAKRVLANGKSFGFERLVVALGSRTDRSIPGAEENAYTLDDPRGASALYRALVAQSEAGGGEVLVIGGGLTAVEAASEIADTMPLLRVRLASMAPVADELSSTARKYLAKRLSDMQVTVSEGVRVKRIEQERAITDQGEIRFSICVLAAGFVASSVALESGLDVNRHRQMRVDSALRSISHPFVYGAGDSAIPTESVGAPIVMSCRTAIPMALHAADCLGNELDRRGPLPMRFADTGRCISLGRNDGLVTVHRPNGVPTEHVITGRAGALVKEGICRYTVARIRAEAFRARLAFEGEKDLARLERDAEPIQPSN